MKTPSRSPSLPRSSSFGRLLDSKHYIRRYSKSQADEIDAHALISALRIATKELGSSVSEGPNSSTLLYLYRRLTSLKLPPMVDLATETSTTCVKHGRGEAGLKLLLECTESFVSLHGQVDEDASARRVADRVWRMKVMSDDFDGLEDIEATETRTEKLLDALDNIALARKESKGEVYDDAIKLLEQFSFILYMTRRIDEALIAAKFLARYSDDWNDVAILTIISIDHGVLSRLYTRKEQMEVFEKDLVGLFRGNQRLLSETYLTLLMDSARYDEVLAFCEKERLEEVERAVRSAKSALELRKTVNRPELVLSVEEAHNEVEKAKQSYRPWFENAKKKKSYMFQSEHDSDVNNKALEAQNWTEFVRTKDWSTASIPERIEYLRFGGVLSDVPNTEKKVILTIPKDIKDVKRSIWQEREEKLLVNFLRHRGQCCDDWYGVLEDFMTRHSDANIVAMLADKAFVKRSALVKQSNADCSPSDKAMIEEMGDKAANYYRRLKEMGKMHEYEKWNRMDCENEGWQALEAFNDLRPEESMFALTNRLSWLLEYSMDKNRSRGASPSKEIVKVIAQISKVSTTDIIATSTKECLESTKNTTRMAEDALQRIETLNSTLALQQERLSYLSRCNRALMIVSGTALAVHVIQML